MRPLRCIFGSHDIERLPSPPGIMHGLFGPMRCRRCPYSKPGFRYPPMPKNPAPSPAMTSEISAAAEGETRAGEAGSLPQATPRAFDCQEFHELCMDYRGAMTPSQASVAYEKLQAYCTANVAYGKLQAARGGAA